MVLRIKLVELYQGKCFAAPPLSSYPICFCFRDSLGAPQDLPLALCSGITVGGTWRTMCRAGMQSRVGREPGQHLTSCTVSLAHVKASWFLNGVSAVLGLHPGSALILLLKHGNSLWAGKGAHGSVQGQCLPVTTRSAPVCLSKGSSVPSAPCSEVWVLWERACVCVGTLGSKRCCGTAACPAP